MIGWSRAQLISRCGWAAVFEDPPAAAKVSTMARLCLVTVAMSVVFVVAAFGCALMWAATR